jgi:hypothetical protein
VLVLLGEEVERIISAATVWCLLVVLDSAKPRPFSVTSLFGVGSEPLDKSWTVLLLPTNGATETETGDSAKIEANVDHLGKRDWW